VVIAIDQAEELFRVEGAEESAALLGLIRDLTIEDQPATIPRGTWNRGLL